MFIRFRFSNKQSINTTSIGREGSMARMGVGPGKERGQGEDGPERGGAEGPRSEAEEVQEERTGKNTRRFQE